MDSKHQLLAYFDHIILRNIIMKHAVKNISKIFELLKYLANSNNTVSIRELRSNMSQEGLDISLITLKQYLQALTRENIIIKIPRYDIKTGIVRTNKTALYFSKSTIRDASAGCQLDHITRIKNDVFEYFYEKSYQIYIGKNRGFQCDFMMLPAAEKSDIYFVYIFSGDDKLALKKQVRSMQKIHEMPGYTPLLSRSYQKYIIVQSFSELGIQKKRYGDVRICEPEDMLKTYKKPS